MIKTPKPKSLSWENNTIKTRNIKWCIDGRFADDKKLAFQLYATEDKDLLFLKDVINNIIYRYPNTLINKSKAYTLAFKSLK